MRILSRRVSPIITSTIIRATVAESAAYTYADIDNDGDLDIVAREVAGPVWVYTNNVTAGNAISFELKDQRGNRSGVGAKVIVHYASQY